MIEVAAAVIVRDGKALLCQRPQGKSCALLWEFPGGKIEPGETPEACAARECEEELGVRLRVLRPFGSVVYAYPDRTVRLRAFVAQIVSGEPERREHARLAWVSLDDCPGYDLCPADRALLASARFDADFAL